MLTATLEEIRSELEMLAKGEDAAFLQRFFKTGPGGYAEGDRFLGIRVPVLRTLARTYRGLPHAETMEMLRSEWHEERLLALLLLVDAFARGEPSRRARIYRDYLDHTAFINNWDLVDSSAPYIIGPFLGPTKLKPLERLARSESLWERRIAILSTFTFIRQGDSRPTLRIAGLLLRDPHDLIHKAVGWMLREVGKRDRSVEEKFLREHQPEMPRTMLRYAIERFPEPLRKQYLTGTFD